MHIILHCILFTCHYTAPLAHVFPDSWSPSWGCINSTNNWWVLASQLGALPLNHWNSPCGAQTSWVLTWVTILCYSSRKLFLQMPQPIACLQCLAPDFSVQMAVSGNAANNCSVAYLSFHLQESGPLPVMHIRSVAYLPILWNDPLWLFVFAVLV